MLANSNTFNPAYTDMSASQILGRWLARSHCYHFAPVAEQFIRRWVDMKCKFLGAALV